MNYIVYKTINKVNGKIYIGVHYTNPKIFDGYIGCGMYNENSQKNRCGFPSAVRKYGYKNFIRKTLFIYPDSEDGKKQAYAKEAEIVNIDFVKSKNTYNLVVGGKFRLYENNKKTIAQYTLSGIFIRTWNSISEAENALGLSAIFQVLSGKSKYCGNFQWRYYSGVDSNIDPCIRKEKTVYQFDLCGNLIKVWKSAKLTGFCVQAIYNVCNNKAKTAYGFFWSYKPKFTYTPFTKCVKVASYDDNGRFIKSYNSLSEAAKENNVSVGNISSCIQGKQKHCKQYRWRYFYGKTNSIKPLAKIMIQSS